jgi:hypothetical protein
MLTRKASHPGDQIHSLARAFVQVPALGMTAASRTRALGTQIEVEYRERRVDLAVTDRGPYVWEQRDRWAESTMGLPAC